ncbi:MAG: hydroxyphenylacetyl-CoA thioesterase PaaI [Bacillota bacterium]
MDPIEQVRQSFSEDTFPRSLGIELLDVGPGYAKLGMKVSSGLLNFLGTAHGGVIFTLADTAMAVAGNSRGIPAVAIQVSINYLSPGLEGSYLIAKAEEEFLTGRTGVYNILVENDQGTRLAVLRGTVFRKSSSKA